jgi:hypothetical protein
MEIKIQTPKKDEDKEIETNEETKENEIVDENSLTKVFVNFFHKGLGKYVSRLFSPEEHGDNFLETAKEFASNPAHSVSTPTSGKVDEPTITDEPVHQVI